MIDILYILFLKGILLLRKLTSKKGQVSMEMGILVAAAIAVAAIAGYFYAKSVRDSAGTAGAYANETLSILASKAQEYADNISNMQ